MATQDKLQTIHDSLADWCLGALTARDPETKRPLLTAAEATVIRGFLKDNDITAAPVEGSKIMDIRKKLEASRAARRLAPVDPELEGLGDGLMQ